MKANAKINILNGSPRGKSSNSRMLIEYFVNGYSMLRRENPEQHYLRNMNKEDQIRLFSDSDYLIVVLPLYTDAMPGIVKEFIENLADLKNSRPKLRMGFIVHSGFPEAHHSVYLAQYLEKLCTRLGCKFMGTVIKGGSEGIQIMPDSMKKKLIKNFTDLGRQFALNGEFDKAIIQNLRSPYQLSRSQILTFNMVKALKLGNWYWNSKLKKNKAYENRYAQPYAG